MGSVNLVVIVESVRTLITKDEPGHFHLPSIIAVGAALGTTPECLCLLCVSHVSVNK